MRFGAPGRAGRHTAAAGLALVAAVGLLSLLSGATTLSGWYAAQPVGSGALGAGSVTLQPVGDGPALQLLSRQPAGSRQFVSGTTCPAPGGFTECRDVSATFGQEALVPGDTVVVTRRVRLEAAGTNLEGTLTVDARSLVPASASPLNNAAQVSTEVTGPAGTTTPLTGGQGAFPVDVAAGRGTGTWTIRSTIAIPADDHGTPWGDRLRGQVLDLDAVQVGFDQT